MNFGQGELGFGACPSAKSKPVAENCTVFMASTPMAFDAPAITDLASCADAVQTIAAASAHPAQILLNMPASFTTVGSSLIHRRRAVNHCGDFASGPGPTIRSPFGIA